MKNLKLSGSCILLLALLSPFFACHGKKGASITATSARSKGELVVAIASEPEKGFDPAIKWPYAGNPIFQSMLFKYDAQSSILPDMATDYTVSEDSKEYRVNLRHDARCPDGTTLDSSDVVFSFNTISKTNAWVDYGFLQEVVANGQWTVIFKLKSPNSAFLHTLAMTAIIPQKFYGPGYAEKPIGAGPYQLVQWDKGQQMIIEANPNYYGGKPRTHRITFLFLSNDAAFAAVQRGEVDLARTSVSLAPRDIPGYRKLVFDTRDGMAIYLPTIPLGAKSDKGKPCGNDVTCDATVRKAINYALDRDGMVESILNGFGEPMRALYEDTVWWNETGEYADNDPEKAKLLLEQAGWKDTDGDGIREKSGIKAEFTLYSVPTDQTASPRQAICLAIQQRLREIGIKLEIETMQYSEIIAKGLNRTNAYLIGTGGDNPYDEYANFHSSMMFKGTNNPSMYANPVVDAYLNEAMGAVAPGKANEYWAKAQWDGAAGFNIQGDAVWVPVLTIQHIYYTREGIDIGELRKAPHRGAPWVCTETITQWGRKE